MASVGTAPGGRGPTHGRRRAGKQKSKHRLRTRIIQGLVLIGLIGGVTAYVVMDKSVTLAVDGSPRTVHTFASSVGQLLSAENVAVGPHDVVVPPPTASLVDGTYVAVRYGREITIDLNGQPQQDWVTADTVQEALTQLGVHYVGAAMSLPPNAPIGRQGLDLTVWTDRHVTILVDGRTMSVNTTAPTVAALLRQQHITLGKQDQASASLRSLPVDGETIRILRISGTIEVTQQSIPFQTTQQNDPNSFTGTQTVITQGQNGLEDITYAIRTVNGVKQPPKQIGVKVVKQPVTQVISVGTKAYPTSVAGASNLDWAALANCESGGNPHAVDPSGTYYGLYQFSVGTWESLGGSGLPSDASPAEQTYRAETLYVRSGAGQWPVCGSNLYH
jgi:uncharacterized protein YabE (DUF348 family)